MLDNVSNVPTVDRVIRTALFDVDTYEEVEADSKLTLEAGGVVALGALATAVGAVLGPADFTGFISTLIVGLIGWVVWAAITLWVGTRFLDGNSDMGEMLRVLGYASGPRILGVIPFVGLFVGSVWSLACSIIAIRQGLDFTTGKAIVTAAVGWVVLLVAQALLGFVF